MPRVLHVLSQRPSLTGSGVTLDALVRHAAAAGWTQRVVVGVPAGEPHPVVGRLPADHVRTLTFEGGRLEFPVPGMSDVMPYRSTRFSEMTGEQIEEYREAWSGLIGEVVDAFRPDVIHSHHLWIVSSILKDVAPGVPVVTQCHATGLRQMRLCPDLADGVRRGCARNDRFVTLHGGDALDVVRELGVSEDRVRVVGAGYRDELFHDRGRSPAGPRRIVYIGKYSVAKGVPWLLDAVQRVAARGRSFELHVVGSGSGAEADEMRTRMQGMPEVRLHHTLSQPELAELLRTCHACVLPSFYEGVPLVLVEALACGCRLVATDLPGVRDELAPHLGTALKTLPLPRLRGVDTPDPRDGPAFVEALAGAIESILDDSRQTALTANIRDSLKRFTWTAVFARVEALWKS